MKKFFEKKEKCIFGKNPEAAFFMTETLMVQKLAYNLASLFLGGGWFLFLF